MLQPLLDLDDIKPDGPRPLARREYDELVNLGVFDDEKIYAEAGVPEYWIIDVSEPGDVSVAVYTKPAKDGYATL